MLTEKEQKQMKALLASIRSGAVEPQEVIDLFDLAMQVISDVQKKLEADDAKDSADWQKQYQECMQMCSDMEKSMKDCCTSAEMDSMMKVMSDKFSAQLKDMEAMIPADTDLTEIDQRIKALEDTEIEIPEKDTPQEVRDGLESLTGNDRLDKSAIKGIEDIEKKLGEVNTTKVGGLFGTRGIQLYVEGTKKGLAQIVNLVAGSNVTISDNLVNGLHTITIASSGGSGFSTLTATEVPNGITTVFTFASASAQPSFIIVDNVWMQATTATGGTNWTWNAGAKQATLTIPPTDDILGIV